MTRPVTDIDIAACLEMLKPAAIEASRNAYSPFSKLNVGCAVLGRDGAVYSGCNVESASYGLTQCAERNALAHAVSQGETRGAFTAILVYTPVAAQLTPCGACRQVMSELMADRALVICCSEGEQVSHWTVDELLPEPFDF